MLYLYHREPQAGAHPFAGGSFGPAQCCHHTPRGRRRVSTPAAAQLTGRPPTDRGLFHAADRWDMGLLLSPSSQRAWVETSLGHFLHLLSPLPRFDSGRPHHLAGTPYRFHKAHDGFLHAFSPSPGACGRILRACTRRRPRKALRLCAFIFCFERW